MYQYEGNSYGQGSVVVPPLPPRPPQPSPPQQPMLPPQLPPQPSLPPRPQIPPQQQPYLPPQQQEVMIPPPHAAPPLPQRPSAIPGQRRNTPTSTPPPMPARPSVPQAQSYQSVLQSHDALPSVGAVGEVAGSLARKGTTGLFQGTAKVFTVFKEDAINNFSDPAPPPIDEDERRRKKDQEKREEEYVKEVRRKALEKKKLKDATAPSPSPSPAKVVPHDPIPGHLPPAPPLPQRPGQQLLNLTLTGYANRTHDKDVFTMYSIDVRWGSTTWTIYRRYSQFHEMNKKLKGDGIVLRSPLPPKQAFGNLDKSFLQQRQEGLRRYLEGLTQQQEEILTTPKRKKILMKFFAPTQMGDLHPPVLPFDVADIL